MSVSPHDASRTPADSGNHPLFTMEGRRLPRDAFPAGEMIPDVAYQTIHDELMIDGNARLNLATFVSTWMEPQAERLIAETSLSRAITVVDAQDRPHHTEEAAAFHH